MIRDIFRFGARAEDVASDDKSIGEFIDELRLGKWFKEYYMLPMCGAIWSTPLADIDKFPSKSLVQFFRNHGLLAGGQTHEWWTVDGGSREYVSRIEAALLKNGATIQLGAPVLGVTRGPLDNSVHISGHSFDAFDEIILPPILIRRCAFWDRMQPRMKKLRLDPYSIKKIALCCIGMFGKCHNAARVGPVGFIARSTEVSVSPIG